AGRSSIGWRGTAGSWLRRLGGWSRRGGAPAGTWGPPSRRGGREGGGRAPTLQVLPSPALDLSFDYDSCRAELGGSWLSTGDMEDLAAAYMGGRPADVLAAPALERNLRGLPESLIVTAEHDVLRDEAERFGRRLLDAGVRVRVLRYPGMLHGFYEYRAVVDAADELWTMVCESIRGSETTKDDLP